MAESVTGANEEGGAEHAGELDAYRQSLVLAAQKSQDSFDKTVLSLSGGALGVSFVFLKDIVGTAPIESVSWLLAAWLSWAASSLAVLFSFYTSHLALHCAIRQCDAGTIYTEQVGGRYTLITRWLNAGGASLFVIGVLWMSIFVSSNLSIRSSAHDWQRQPSTESSTPAATGLAPAEGPRKAN